MKTRTDNDLRSEFLKKLHNWQCKKLFPVSDLAYVILNLLKEKFVVEIDGYKYDLSFGKSRKTGQIEYSYSSYPSPHLMSSEFIDRAFKEGHWFIVTDEDLSKEEIEEILKPIRKKEEEELDEFYAIIAEECIEKMKNTIKTNKLKIDEITDILNKKNYKDDSELTLLVSELKKLNKDIESKKDFLKNKCHIEI